MKAKTIGIIISTAIRILILLSIVPGIPIAIAWHFVDQHEIGSQHAQEMTAKAQAIQAAKIYFKEHTSEANYKYETAMSYDEKYEMIRPYIPGDNTDARSFIGNGGDKLYLGQTLDSPVRIYVPWPYDGSVFSE